jgi:hypothetical protein
VEWTRPTKGTMDRIGIRMIEKEARERERERQECGEEGSERASVGLT